MNNVFSSLFADHDKHRFLVNLLREVWPQINHKTQMVKAEYPVVTLLEKTREFTYQELKPAKARNWREYLGDVRNAVLQRPPRMYSQMATGFRVERNDLQLKACVWQHGPCRILVTCGYCPQTDTFYYMDDCKVWEDWRYDKQH